ncbi:ABC transporter ATP-binding protein [Scatolibacter rhodanostii]|uniref:ABC transporter ATP-binding protein n=1 Tax=Scatolibacter rhodanostii TaxID=2014781 RepID=UPI000C08651C|nr:ABC transporter ATP-binding protein [Scatolibacter rhodanostii]
MNKTKFQKAGRLIRLCMQSHKLQFILPIVFTAAGSVLGALNPIIIGLAITELSNNVKAIAADTPGAQINYQYVLRIAIILLISAAVRQGITYLGSFLLAGGVQDSFKDLRTRISQKMNRLPVSYFDKNRQGTVLNTVTNDVDAVANAVQQSLLPMVYAITSIIGTFIMVLFISVPLGLLSMIMIPLAFLLSRYVMKRSQKHFSSMQNSLAELNGYIQERYTGFSVVKLYNAEEDTVEQFKDINQRLNQAGFKGSFISSLLSPLIEFLINFTYVVMVLLTGYAVLFSGMTLGNMQAFVQYIWLIYEPMGQITQLSPAVQSAAASMERIINFLEEPEEDQEEAKAERIDVDRHQGQVEFVNIQFAYQKSKPLIKDFSLMAKPGQKIAIVGATGAGKTTIINLLMRFYEVNAGDIRIDGESIYDMRRSASRSLFGMVLQDAWLYHATIAENIRFGNLNATDEEVIQAAKDANVHHFIKTMPGGYDMMINEEASNVSLGQKQLLTIARALLANPRILILDEATSSVDTRLEMLIQVAMKRAMEGRTSFVIAHRLSTIKDADLILVMNQGDIVEQGTHHELLALNGTYEKLYNSQFSKQ